MVSGQVSLCIVHFKHVVNFSSYKAQPHDLRFCIVLGMSTCLTYLKTKVFDCAHLFSNSQINQTIHSGAMYSGRTLW